MSDKDVTPEKDTESNADASESQTKDGVNTGKATGNTSDATAGNTEDAALANDSEKSAANKGVNRPSGGDDSDPSAEEYLPEYAADGPAPGLIENWDEEDGDNEDTDTAGEADASPDGDSSESSEDPADTDNVPAPPPPFPFEETAVATTDDTDEDEYDEDEDEYDDDEVAPDDDEPMTLMNHLGELRTRLKNMFIASVIGCLICYNWAELLFDYLRMPMLQVMPEASTFIYTAPQEAFLAYLKIAFLAGIFLTSPYIFYQLWSFISPGLYAEEKKYIIPIAGFSAIFFIGGGSFAYFVVFRYAFEFFMSFNTETIQAQLKLNEYLSFTVKLLLAFGLVFELPLVTFFLARMGVATAQLMRKMRKYAVLCSFILSAILTPPDVISQLLMAGPLMILYEISVIIAAVFGRKPAPQEDDDEEEDYDDDYEDEDEEYEDQNASRDEGTDNKDTVKA